MFYSKVLLWRYFRIGQCNWKLIVIKVSQFFNQWISGVNRKSHIHLPFLNLCNSFFCKLSIYLLHLFYLPFYARKTLSFHDTKMNLRMSLRITTVVEELNQGLSRTNSLGKNVIPQSSFQVMRLTNSTRLPLDTFCFAYEQPKINAQL